MFAFFIMPLHEVVAAEHKDRVSLRRSTEESEFSGAFSPPKASLREHLKKIIGIPYRWGGASTKGMDCSGLTKYIYAHFLGVNLPHNSVEQSKANELEEISTSESELEIGDLLFFGPRKKNISHVGMYLSDGKFIHASRSSGVNISSLSRNYWKERLITTKRLKDLNQPTASEHYGIFGMQEPFALSVADLVNSPEQTLELGYCTRILDSINLNVDTFLQMTPATGEQDTRSMNLDGWGQGHLDTILASETRQGFRLFADLTPFNWLRITPSVTHLNNWGLGTKPTDAAVQILGLEALLKPPASRWSFAMSAQTGNGEDVLNGPPKVSPDWNSLEVGFGLGLRLSDSFNCSFMGMSNSNEMRELSDKDRGPLPVINNFAIQVDFAF